MIKELRSLQHPLVKHLVKLRKDRKYRREQGRVVIFGKSMVDEVCADSMPYHVLHAEPAPKGANGYEVSEEILRKIAGVQSADSVLAEVDMPPEEDLSDARRIIVLDQVSDPGNMGTLLRTALALGWDGAFILDSSVDPFNDKALRSSKGAAFRLPLQWGSWEDLAETCPSGEWTRCVADLDGQDPSALSSRDRVMLILGNESRGPSAEAKAMADAVSIPMPGPMESLNVAVAGGILMHMMKGSSNG